MAGFELHFDIIDSIQRHISQLKPYFPKTAVLVAGEYVIESLLKHTVTLRDDDVVPIFIGQSGLPIAGSHDFVDLHLEGATQFWYNIYPEMEKNENFSLQLKNRSVHKVHNAIVLSSTWDGLGSGLFPTLLLKLKSWNVNSLAIAILPLKDQPVVSQFNTLSSIGLGLYMCDFPILLIDRECLEKYIGVNRNGSIVSGDAVVGYMLELLLAKEATVDELTMLFRSFNVKLFTVILSTGSSLRIYGSLENILEASLLRPLLNFDISETSVLYVLLRAPEHMKDILSKEKIELAIVNWIKEVANPMSINVSEPIFVEDVSDRIDILVFVGGFNVDETFTQMDKKVGRLRNEAIKKGFMSEDKWRKIVNSLVES